MIEAGKGKPPGRAGKLRGKAAKVALGALVLTLVLLGVAQVVLPILAAKVVKDRVARYGQVKSASVSATPALQLLWGSADSATVVAGRLQISPGQLVKLLLQSSSVEDLTVRASGITITEPGLGAGPIDVKDAVLQKRGDRIHLSGTLTEQALAAALPEGVSAEVLRSEGKAVLVRASGQLFGFQAYIDALVHASEGKLLLTPTKSLFAGLVTITLFSNPSLQVLDVSAKPLGGSAWRLSAEASLNAS